MTQDVCLVRDSLFLEHSGGDAHPENAKRLAAIYSALDALPLTRDLPTLAPCLPSDAALQTAHTRALVEAIRSLTGSGWIDSDTYYNEESSNVALRAAGSCASLALKILKGDYRRGFAAIRPPGHHATAERAMGFCLLNSVAVTAAALLLENPKLRIAIVDFDLHHGNGTQDIFYGDPRVLVVSSHRYPYYPGTGGLQENGAAKGMGTTVNFPLGLPYGSAHFKELYGRFVAPILLEFAPDFILCSAGFDGHIDDPMQGFRIQTETYATLTQQLVAVAEKTANGKILFCLEGGYSPDALAASVSQVVMKLVTLPRAPFAIPQNDEALSDTLVLDQFHQHYRSQFPTL